MKAGPEIVLEARVSRQDLVNEFNNLDVLFNSILQGLGVNVYLERTATGFVMYFGNYSDFRACFARFPLEAGGGPEAEDGQVGAGELKWVFHFVAVPPGHPEEELVDIMKNNYESPSLGTSFTPVDEGRGRGSGGRKHYAVVFPSKDAYTSRMEKLIEKLRNAPV
ncbi:MAG: hypothetical protein ACTSU5_21480 [Promethearchaeota archaeon]